MNIVNIEFKAKVKNLIPYEQKLLTLNPKYIGTDNQCDTYFNVPTGRLKLREGNIENSLIHYERENTAEAKLSNIILYKHTPDLALKNILLKTHTIKVIVNKKRKIYFINNTKFHFDEVDNLGYFIEVESIDNKSEKSIEELKVDCEFYKFFFEIKTSQLKEISYSDMLLNNQVKV